MVVYTLAFWPVALAGSKSSITCESAIVGTTRSMPMRVTCTGGKDVTMRPLPSLVTMMTAPFSATAKLQPVTPMSPRPKTLPAAAPGRTREHFRVRGELPPGLSGKEGGDLLPAHVQRRRDNVGRGVARELDDVLSQIRLHGPHASAMKASLRSTSSDTMDLDLMTVRTPRRRATRIM